MDGRNPAPADRWFLPLFISIKRVSTTQGGAGFLPSTVELPSTQGIEGTRAKRDGLLGKQKRGKHATMWGISS